MPLVTSEVMFRLMPKLTVKTIHGCIVLTSAVYFQKEKGEDVQSYTETDYEHSLIKLFKDTLGYAYVYGPEVERDFHNPLFHTVLEDSLYRINADLPQEAIQEALSKLQHFENAELLQKNKRFLDYLQNGIEVQYFD